MALRQTVDTNERVAEGKGASKIPYITKVEK